MKQLKRILLSLSLVLSVGFALAPASTYAINVFDPSSTGGVQNACTTDVNKDSSVCSSAKVDNVNPMIQKVINIMLYILGAIAVIMIIIGGLMYTTSAGDAGGVKKAKDTILYAVIGLVVAILAFAIVNFVVTAFQ